MSTDKDSDTHISVSIEGSAAQAIEGALPSNSDKPHMSDKSATTGKEIKRSLTILIIATVFLYIALVGVVAWAYSLSHANTVALCAFRDDAQRRLDQNKQYLGDHPRGVAGLSPKQLQANIANSEQTIKSLTGLNC